MKGNVEWMEKICDQKFSTNLDDVGSIVTKSLTYGIGARLKNVENYDKKIGQNLGSNEFSYDLDVGGQYLSSGPCQNRRMWTTKN